MLLRWILSWECSKNNTLLICAPFRVPTDYYPLIIRYPHVLRFSHPIARRRNHWSKTMLTNVISWTVKAPTKIYASPLTTSKAIRVVTSGISPKIEERVVHLEILYNFFSLLFSLPLPTWMNRMVKRGGESGKHVERLKITSRNQKQRELWRQRALGKYCPAPPNDLGQVHGQHCSNLTLPPRHFHLGFYNFLHSHSPWEYVKEQGWTKRKWDARIYFWKEHWVCGYACARVRACVCVCDVREWTKGWMERRCPNGSGGFVLDHWETSPKPPIKTQRRVQPLSGQFLELCWFYGSKLVLCNVSPHQNLPRGICAMWGHSEPQSNL